MWKYKANKAIFVTTSDYSDYAYEQARGAPIELWNYEKLCNMIEKFILKIPNLESKRDAFLPEYLAKIINLKQLLSPDEPL